MILSPADPDLLTLNRVRELLPRPRPGRKVGLAAVYRWATKGIGGVRLETVRVGGRLFTTPAAIEAFCRQLRESAERRSRCAGGGGLETPRPARPGRTMQQREDWIRAAELELAAEGLG